MKKDENWQHGSTGTAAKNPRKKEREKETKSPELEKHH